MRTRNIGLAAILGLAALCLSVSPALAQNASVTGAGAATLPVGASFSGVPLTGLRFGIGTDIASGTASGDFQATLLGSVAGQPRSITVEGKSALGSLPAPGTAAFSGVCAIDMGDGTPALAAVPFALTVVTSSTGKGSLALTLGTTSLPAGTVNAGGLTVQ